ncbi:MAG: glycosyltransferase, partial [Actinomycetota bacterium]|nr:glycosyltransferase [Actinomycetota bacterium]
MRGKFLYRAGEQIDIRGVTYGTFSPDETGVQFPARATVAEDFATMAMSGINAVRTYTVPPRWLLDLAADRGLLVLVGVPWTDHVAFLENRSRRRSVEKTVREAVRSCAGHPAVLGYAVGNEISAPIARWYGRRRIESFIERLYRAAKEEDPQGLVTYVNYPTTEYLQLPFLDFVSFNVYLEAQHALESYLARLHNIAGDCPLVMAEVGLDSRRNGESEQARVLEWQIETIFDSGCAGAFVFAWTDEWHRGGFEIDDWDFGLVDRERRPKEALGAVRHAFERVGQEDAALPLVSVIVCTFNGERWLPGCLEALSHVDYPRFEVIVVDDGSTDGTAAIASRHGVRLVRSQENRGLSEARNLGLYASSGEIVAYLDDDARPDPVWLRHLARKFSRSPHAGVGGPNIAPEGDGLVADCVADSPGGPIHVLVGDELAEHIPGCNMAFRREALEAIGGFDPRFWIAGDDVDVCWRLQAEGHTLGFSPGASVWHHRRGSVRAYLRQQYQYGKAEGLLERKWPERYNRAGHLSWAGRVYGRGASSEQASRRAKVGYGTWGTRLFQSLYEPSSGTWSALPGMPEFYLLIAALAGLSALGLLWAPLLAALIPLALALGGVAIRAVLATSLHASRCGPDTSHRVTRRVLTIALHALQPLARLAGRLRQGLSPWRRRGEKAIGSPLGRTVTVWSERWEPLEQRLTRLERQLLAQSRAVVRGTEFDRWDLELRGGLFGVARILATVEEHGGGRQLLLFRVRPRLSRDALGLSFVFGALCLAAALDGALVAVLVLGAMAGLGAGLALYDCSIAVGTVQR